MNLIVFTILLYLTAAKREVDAVNAQLAKEIQLKHRAPVVAINIIDSNSTSLGDSMTSNVSADEALPHRVVISSEEQFKVTFISNFVNCFIASKLSRQSN